MSSAVEILEERVVAAADLIVTLRSKVQSLERELMTALVETPRLPSHPPLPAADSSLAAELVRLRAEREVVRDSIRGLLREIDRVSW
jgi:hypothetical protein